MVANSSMTRGEGSTALTALDFVPEWAKKEIPVIPETEDEMIASMADFFNCGPGKPN
jgi:hypothetical protein